jgi:hypothetical protein
MFCFVNVVFGGQVRCDLKLSVTSYYSCKISNTNFKMVNTQNTDFLSFSTARRNPGLQANMLTN